METFTLKHLETGFFWTGKHWTPFKAEAKEFKREANALATAKKASAFLARDGLTASVAEEIMRLPTALTNAFHKQGGRIVSIVEAIATRTQQLLTELNAS